ncbi:transposase, partial [Streptomyces sp. NPDC003328]
MAKAGVLIPASDLFSIDGRARLGQTALAGPYAQRVASLLKLIDGLDAEEALFNGRIVERLRDHTGYRAIQQLPGIGTTLAAVLVAEIGDVRRFASADRPCSWAGLTPRHYESDTTVRRGHVTKQGSKLVRWAVEAIQRNTTPKITEDRARIEARRGRVLDFEDRYSRGSSATPRPAATRLSAVRKSMPSKSRRCPLPR